MCALCAALDLLSLSNVSVIFIQQYATKFPKFPQYNEKVGVRSHVLMRSFIRLRLFHFMGHKVEKTESRALLRTQYTHLF